MPPPDEPPDDLVSTATDYWGRTVSVSEDSVAHIAERHPEIRPEDLPVAIQRADKRSKRNPRSDRETLWKRDLGPARWFCVVVAYEGRIGRVKTAYGSSKGPREADLI